MRDCYSRRSSQSDPWSSLMR